MKKLGLLLVIAAAVVAIFHRRTPPLPMELSNIDCPVPNSYTYARLGSFGLFLPCEDVKAKADLEQAWREEKIHHRAPISGFAYILKSDGRFVPDPGTASPPKVIGDVAEYGVSANFMARSMRYSAPIFEKGPLHELRNVVVQVPHVLAQDGAQATFVCDLPPSYPDINGGYQCSGELSSEQLHWELRINFFNRHLTGIDPSKDIEQVLNLIAAHIG